MPCASASAGILDTGFGHDGTITANFPRGGQAVLSDVAIQPDGKIVAVGLSHNASQPEGDGAGVMRFTLHGGLDPSFGSGGQLVLSQMIRATAVAVQPDGRILVAGLAGETFGNNLSFVVARLLPDGSLDPSFGSGGVFSTTAGRPSHYLGVVGIDILAGGGIQVSGFQQRNAKERSVFLRLDADGNLDPGFGTGGVRRSEFYRLLGVDVLPSGAFVGVGYSTRTLGEFDLVRYRRGGALDTSFGTDGVEPVDGAGSGGVAIDASGGIVVAGGPRLQRYEPDGKLDPGFGRGGRVTLHFGSYEFDVLSIAIDPHGRIVAAGSTNKPSPSNNGFFAVGRLTSGGNLDPSFSRDGKATVAFTEGTTGAQTVDFEPNGAIVLGGLVGTPKVTLFALARLLPS